MWILHHGNTSIHLSVIIDEFLARNSIAILHHIPYSLHLTSCDFFLSSKLQIIMLYNADNVKCKTTILLKSLVLQNFEGYFEQWNWIWDK